MATGPAPPPATVLAHAPPLLAFLHPLGESMSFLSLSLRQQPALSVLCLLLGTYVLYQSANLTTFERDYDEGVYLAEVQLLHAGYSLYSDVRSASPPVFLWILYAVFAVAGSPSVAAARFVFVLMSIAGLIALSLIGRSLAPVDRRGAVGLLAPLLLILVPLMMCYGHLAMADVPSLSLSLLAIALAIHPQRLHRRWFFASGLVTALALGVKLLAAYTAPLLAVVVLLSQWNRQPWSLRRFILDGFATLSGFLLVAVAIVTLLDWRAAYDIVFHFPWAAGRQLYNPREALRVIVVFHRDHLGWALLALIGLVYLARLRAWRAIVLLSAWEALVVTLLTQHAPVFKHLLLPLMPPVVLAGAIAGGEIMAALAKRRLIHVIPLLVALVVFVTGWSQAFETDWKPAPQSSHQLRTTIIPWLQTVVAKDDRILTDDPMIAVRANRLVPHDMADTSFTKIRSGFLTSADLIASAQRDRPGAIIFWSGRFRSLPDWQRWVESHYVVARRESRNAIIFLRPFQAKAAEE